MAKKINLSGVKDFMFNHGEKVALGTCVSLALFFGIGGLYSASSASKNPESGNPWVLDLNRRFTEISDGVARAEVPKLPEETKKKLHPDAYKWDPITSVHQPWPYLNVAEAEDKKRHNPVALAAKTGRNDKTRLSYSQLDYVPGLYLTHEVSPQAVKGLDVGGVGAAMPGLKKGPPVAGPAASGGPFVPLRAGDPRRLIVGHMVFPMKNQVLEFQRALKMLSQKDMLEPATDDAPSPRGLNIIRIEILPGGKEKDPEIIMNYDPAAKEFKVAPRLQKFLSAAIFDEATPRQYKQYVFAGLTVPLPKLAYGSYPRFNLEGLPIDWEDEEVMQKDPGKQPPTMRKGGGGGTLPGFGNKGGPKEQPKENDPAKTAAGAVISVKRKDLQAIDPPLERRLWESDFNYFHVLGTLPTPKDAINPNQPPAGRPNLGGGAAEGDYFTAWTRDAAAAPGQPGKQLDLQRPKGPTGPGGDPAAQAGFPAWDRDALIQFIDVDVEPGKTYKYGIQVRLANPNFGKTKDVAYGQLATIEEIVSDGVYTDSITIPYEYYLYALDQDVVDAHARGEKPYPADPKLKDVTTFQIHQWTKTSLDQANSTEHKIGDWAVAERIPVRKGDPIGYEVHSQVPAWIAAKDAFVVEPKSRTNPRGGIKLTLLPTPMDNFGGTVHDAPYLVDFTGGRRKLSPQIEEESAVEALILTPAGKLRVLNSRDATDAANELAKERQDRVVRARQRIADVSGSGAPKKGPGMPAPGGGN